MQLTHFGHSCLLVELEGTRLLIDPGTFAGGFTQLTGLDAVLVTHHHPDHVDIDALPALLRGNPDAALLADPTTAAQLGDPWTAVNPGEQVQVGPVQVRVEGGRHAVIHPDLPVVDNVAYLLGTAGQPNQLLHPGDSFHVPDVPVDVLAIPTGAPWLKISEAVDYLRAVAPRVAVPIHQAVLANPAMHYRLLRLLKPEATEFQELPEGAAAQM